MGELFTLSEKKEVSLWLPCRYPFKCSEEYAAINVQFIQDGDEDAILLGDENLTHPDSEGMSLAVSSAVASNPTTPKHFDYTPEEIAINMVDIANICAPMQLLVLVFVLGCLLMIRALEPVQRAFKLARCIHAVAKDMQSVMDCAVVVCNRGRDNGFSRTWCS